MKARARALPVSVKPQLHDVGRADISSKTDFVIVMFVMCVLLVVAGLCAPHVCIHPCAMCVL
jgi:hypothetical protein